MDIFAHDFRQTWLWRQAFQTPRSDSTTEEQDFFRMQYLSIRERASQLVSRISADLPMLTIHDISHLDALWDIASTVAEGAVNVNPAEAFVLGASILLHDSAMSLAAYPGGLAEIKATIAWKDAIARLALASEEAGGDSFEIDDPPDSIVQRVLPDVLRRLHAERAEQLAEQVWSNTDGSTVQLIEESELRRFYGPTIGRIAHSHWWSIQKVEQELSGDQGALASRTANKIDRIKLACLLRVSDALHLDSRRAPRFLRTILNPSGLSAHHWSFQERLAHPHIELDAVVFTTGQPFGREDAESWWLAYDTLNAVDRELRDVDQLLQSRGREVLKARRVKGAGSPEILARAVETRGWRPVDARLQATDVPRIVENLGGTKLYGDDPTVALRELIQNGADAVQARRKYEKRSDDWGAIKVGLRTEVGQTWLFVEDNGIGMSEQVLTGPLLDFGTSFWRSPLAMEEFPGLMASGMHAIGRFGIGFFSVFMLGDVVRVYSRRCDKGRETGRLLEFRGGTSCRPILSPASDDPVPIDGGTRVEVLLKDDPKEAGGLLHVDSYSKKAMPLAKLVGVVAPNLEVAVEAITEKNTQAVAQPGDWLKISDFRLMSRIHPTLDREEENLPKGVRNLMQPIVSSSGQIFGRAFIVPSRFYWDGGGGCITISGLRAAKLRNVDGVLLGEAITATREFARPLATIEALANWASKQAELIATSIEDEERQARTAEVVLECGGNVGNLKVVKWGSNWLTSKEFEDRLRSCAEIAVSFDGEFDYDEDQDDVHPKEFREDFTESENIIIVFKHDGTLLSSNKYNWPRAISCQTRTGASCLEDRIRNIIRQVWGEDFEEDEELRVVGQVRQSDISRNLTIFRLVKADEDF